jgi:hypothetical protein
MSKVQNKDQIGGIAGIITNFIAPKHNIVNNSLFINLYKQIIEHSYTNFTSDNLIATVNPDSLGRYIFKVTPNVYSIRIYGSRFSDKEVWNIEVKPDSIIIVDIYLQSNLISEPFNDDYKYQKIKRIPIDSLNSYFKK